MMMIFALITLFSFLTYSSVSAIEIAHKSSSLRATHLISKQEEANKKADPEESLNRFVKALEDIVKNANNDPLEIVKQLQMQGLLTQMPDIKF
jgi:hypothetical protein